MKLQGRIVLAIGLFAAAIALVTGVRHCLRRMTRSGALNGAVDLRRRRSADACGLADGGGDTGNDQSQETGALAA
jgi:hypothetical protein